MSDSEVKPRGRLLEPSQRTARRFAHKPRGTPAGLLGVSVFLVLAVGIPVYAVPNPRFTETISVVAYLLVAYSAARLALIAAHGRPELLQTAFWTMVYSFVALPFLAQITAHEYALATGYEYSQSTIVSAEVLFAVGLVGFDVGRLLARKGNRSSVHSETGPGDRGQIWPAACIVIGYIGLGFVLLSVLRHGLASFFTSRDALTQNFLGPASQGVKFYLNSNKAAGSSLQALSQVPIFVGTYYLLAYRKAYRAAGVWLPSWWLLFPLIAGNLIINNPIANARFWYVTVLFGFILIYFPVKTRPAAARAFLLGFVFVSLFSFHQLAAFRRTGQTDLANVPLHQSLLTDPDYASPQQMLNGIEYVHAHGYEFGRQLAGALFVWVPRSIWTSKPGDTGQLIGSDAGFKVSAPLWTEGQVDFGLVGAFAFLAVVGVLALRLDRRYRSARPGDAVTLLAPVLASLSVFLLRGSLQPAIGSVIPVLGIALICRRPFSSPARSTRRRRTNQSVVSDHVQSPTGVGSDQSAVLIAPLVQEDQQLGLHLGR